MNRHPSEPLTQEERELAQLIARVGPHGEPPASLDAKILGAAHAAADRKPQRTRKPRWPVAMGLAASVIFAVGIAWQLRPLQPTAPPSSEAPAPAAAAMTSPAEAEPAMAAAPPAAVDAVAQDSAAAATGPADISIPAPPPEPAAKALPPRSPSVSPPRRATRIPPPAAPPVQRQAQDTDRHIPSQAMPPPPAPPAPSMAAPAPVAEAPAAFVAEPNAGAVAEGFSANQAAGYSAARTAAAKQGAAHEESKASAAIREQERSKQESAARESAARERNTLDSIEVTGSRLQRTDRQVPVSDDARLPVDQWLERVRTRYGLGDADAAKRSLLLFIHEHPSETVPSDLEPLLKK